jgi:hypothetical protein
MMHTLTGTHVLQTQVMENTFPGTWSKVARNQSVSLMLKGRPEDRFPRPEDLDATPGRMSSPFLAQASHSVPLGREIALDVYAHVPSAAKLGTGLALGDIAGVAADDISQPPINAGTVNI